MIAARIRIKCVMANLRSISMFSFCIFFAFQAIALEGLVEVESKYQNFSKQGKFLVPHEGQELKYKGSGFIVDYPIKSISSGKETRLKVVLTAAHLALGGIYSTRWATLKLKVKGTEQELSYMGFIADALHDLAVIVLCTPENTKFMKEILKVENPYYSQFKDKFVKGEGCLPTGKLSFDPQSYASYQGDELVLSPLNENQSWNLNVADWVTGKGKLIYNQKEPVQAVAFKKISASTAVPNINYQSNGVLPLVDFDLSKLTPTSLNLPDQFNQFLFEKYFYQPLEEGYSGAPIMQRDVTDGGLVVTGVYKSSTLSGATDRAGYGWYSSIYLSQGLLQQFLQTFPNKLHTWTLTPQTYIFSLEGQLVREQAFPMYNLLEVPQHLSETIAFERKDRGGSEWVRADTGDASHKIDFKYKSLMAISEEFPVGVPVSGVLLRLGEARENILFPPTMESLRFVSKYNCKSCVNSNDSTYVEQSNYHLFYAGELVSVLQKTMKEKTTYTLQSSNEGLAKKIEVKIQNEGENLKVFLGWEDDSIKLDVLQNNKISFEHPEKGLQEVHYQPVLKVKTKKGATAYLELAGLIYYNTELPEGYPYNGKAFRMVLDGKFHLFIQRD